MAKIIIIGIIAILIVGGGYWFLAKKNVSPVIDTSAFGAEEKSVIDLKADLGALGEDASLFKELDQAFDDVASVGGAL